MCSKKFSNLRQWESQEIQNSPVTGMVIAMSACRGYPYPSSPSSSLLDPCCQHFNTVFRSDT